MSLLQIILKPWPRAVLTSENGEKYNFAEPLYGQSLLQPIPLERTCATAGIPEIYCTCQEESTLLGPDNPLALQSASVLLNHINDNVLNGESSMWRSASEHYNKVVSLRGEKDSEVSLELLKRCVPLSLDAVKEAELLPRPGGKQVVRLSFSTKPNGGIYEGRVEWGSDGHGLVKEDIERSNRYGSQSDCLSRALLIMVPFVRSACYCS